jgi:GT2 family glycosyltransferase
MRIAAVVPVKNKADVLAACIDSICAARRKHPSTTIILVDNGSTDGSVDILNRYSADATIIHSSARCVGGVRNDGAIADQSADAYAFLDCDCVVPEDFFADVVSTLEETEAAAVGCEVVSPADGHWSEIAWDGLHRPGGDGPRHYINSACFCIRREWFDRIQGFDADKVSSEDVDICRRLAAEGGTMWQSEKLAVLHLGNPKTLAGLYRRIRWHGSGIWERGKGVQWSVSTVATLLNPLAIIAFTTIGLWLAWGGKRWGWGLVVSGPLIMPLLFVAARALQHRRAVPIVGGTALMVITFAARLDGLIRSALKPAKPR